MYKYEKQALSIQRVIMRENISSSKNNIIDSLHLPFQYKYDNFCDFIIYTENHVFKKFCGFRSEL